MQFCQNIKPFFKMWKSVLGRVVHSRSIATTSHSFFNNKGPSFSDTEYVKEKPRYGRKRGEFSERNNFRDKYEKNTEGRGRRDMFDSEKRHVSFDSTRGGPEYPTKNYDKYKQEFNKEPRERSNGFEDDRRNANLSPIGTPGKWKVGAGFVQEAEKLRSKVRTQHDFAKALAKNQKIKKDPGIRRQVRAVEEFSDPNKFPSEEELDEEVDVLKFDKLYDKSQQTKSQVREMVQLKMVQQKYFKEGNRENILSWSDKEHIRYLHNSDPQQWTFEMIAEQFRIDPQVAKAVATAKWIPKKPQKTEGIPINSEEIYPLENVNDENQINEPPAMKHSASSNSKKPLTWRELRASMGDPEDAVNSAKHSEPARVEPEELVDKDMIFQYLSHGSPVKWANDNSRTEPQSKEDVSAFFHDNKIENQVLYRFFSFSYYVLNFFIFDLADPFWK